MKCGDFPYFLSSWRSSSRVRLVIAILMFGMMPLLSQSSSASSTQQTNGSGSLNQSNNPLLPLLSEQMSDLLRLEEYQQQREALYQESLRDKEELKALLQNSGQIISDLKRNLEISEIQAEQMGERLQEADLWNVELMERNTSLEQTITRKNTAIMILSFLLVLIMLVFVVYIILKMKKVIQ